MSTAAASLAALSFALTCLLAERGAARNPGLRRIAQQPRTLARLLAGAALLGSVAAALVQQFLPAIAASGASLAALLVAPAASFALLRRAQSGQVGTAAPWLIALLVLALAGPALLAGDAVAWLLTGLLGALALLLGIPAFAVLARRLDDADVPAPMRGLPARALATAVLALALAGSLAW